MVDPGVLNLVGFVVCLVVLVASVVVVLVERRRNGTCDARCRQGGWVLIRMKHHRHFVGKFHFL